MSSEPHEIVIIKRHGGHEEEHHGGVWKIAFADFMTAMMAFFLVMWLISANDKTKAVIARYFNPVQLVDSTPQPKGLEDPKAGSPSVMPKAAQPAPDPKDKADAKTEKVDGRAEIKVSDGKADTQKVGSETKVSPNAPATAGKSEHLDEADLFRDPYAVLAEISGKNQAQPAREQTKAVSDGNKGGAGAVGRKGGDAYRDPFEPVPLQSSAAGQALNTTAAELPVPGATAATTTGSESSKADGAAKAAGKTAPVTPQGAKDETSDPSRDASAMALSTPKDDKSKAPAAQAATLDAKLEAAIRQTAGSVPGGSVPKLEVRHTSEGTIIDLTDGANFSMFGIASARPAPTMVALMEKIGATLKTEKGLVTIRGFTDNRPYRSDTYDNWRLSAARAHMAHYMLVRGGLDEQRVERIEGYADRQPKNPNDPGGAENRRIEILLRDPGK